MDSDIERKRLFDEMMAYQTKSREEVMQRAEQNKINIAKIKEANEANKVGAFSLVMFMLAFILVGAAIVFFSLHSFGVIKTILGFFVFAVVGGLFIGIFGTTDQKNEMAFGPFNQNMSCPHCKTAGNIRTKSITQKKGVSGGKAVAGILTGGVSLLAVGLSRKEDSTQAHCQKCNNTWQF